MESKTLGFASFSSRQMPRGILLEPLCLPSTEQCPCCLPATVRDPSAMPPVELRLLTCPIDVKVTGQGNAIKSFWRTWEGCCCFSESFLSFSEHSSSPASQQWQKRKLSPSSDPAGLASRLHIRFHWPNTMYMLSRRLGRFSTPRSWPARLRACSISGMLHHGTRRLQH